MNYYIFSSDYKLSAKDFRIFLQNMSSYEKNQKRSIYNNPKIKIIEDKYLPEIIKLIYYQEYYIFNEYHPQNKLTKNTNLMKNIIILLVSKLEC